MLHQLCKGTSRTRPLYNGKTYASSSLSRKSHTARNGWLVFAVGGVAALSGAWFAYHARAPTSNASDKQRVALAEEPEEEPFQISVWGDTFSGEFETRTAGSAKTSVYRAELHQPTEVLSAEASRTAGLESLASGKLERAYVLLRESFQLAKKEGDAESLFWLAYLSEVIEPSSSELYWKETVSALALPSPSGHQLPKPTLRFFKAFMQERNIGGRSTDPIDLDIYYVDASVLEISPTPLSLFLQREALFHHGCYFAKKGMFEEAIKKWQDAAAKGQADAEFNLGIAYLFGRGTRRDEDLAANFFLSSAEKHNNAQAQFYLALLAHHSNDNENALDFLRKAAAEDHVAAQYYLSTILTASKSNRRETVPEGIKWLEIASSKGHTKAQFELAMYYENGIRDVLPSDPLKSIPLYIAAASQGHEEAQYNLAVIYANGIDGLLPRDLKEAVRWYEESAKNGVASAHYNLGIIYLTGDKESGLASNPALSVRFFEEAAKLGHKKAQFNLGNIYSTNSDVLPRNIEEAIRWYKAAAAQGDNRAKYNLGLLYSTGEGVAQDYQEALLWYTDAAYSGDIESQFNLASMYATGKGTTKDFGLAINWFTNAAKAGHVDAQFILGAIRANERIEDGIYFDTSQAIHWLALAASQGHPRALPKLGWLYANGRGAHITDIQTMHCIKKIAEQGDRNSQYVLGLVYTNGNTTSTRDIEEGIRWYRASAQQGHIGAQVSLGKIYAHGLLGDDHLDLAEGIRWFRQAAGQGDKEAGRHVKILQHRLQHSIRENSF